MKLMDRLTIYTDGASRGNPGQAAAAWIILREAEVLESEVRVLGVQTNNAAEYTALGHALKAANKYTEPGNAEIFVYSDSELVISQMNGSYAIRSPALKPLYEEAKRNAAVFARVNYTHVPRENPYIGSCDWLCNSALNAREKPGVEEPRPAVTCTPIGIVHSPFREKKDAPHQGKHTDLLSTIDLHPEYRAGLLGLKPGDAVFVLCWFDRSDRSILQVIPHGATEKTLTGVFATRAPVRPNPISLTLVTIREISGTTLTIKGLEALDGTPVLDIKPYYSGIDCPESLT